MISYLLFMSICFANPKEIHVLFCIDDRLHSPTAVVLTSMFENANPNTFCYVHVQIPGCFKPEFKKKICSLKEKYGNCKIEFVDMGDSFRDLSGIFFPHSALYYVLAANLFPSIRKLIFLDGDIIVRHDLSHLYDTSLENYYVAGVRDPIEISCGWETAKKKVKILKILNLEQYVNTGILLLNLKKFREENVENEFLKFIEKEKKYLVSIESFQDQDVINTVCYGSILVLPIKFNAMVNLIDFSEPHEKNAYAMKCSTPKDWEEAKNPIIVHFAASPKPWTNNNKTKYHEEWKVYSKKTGLWEKIEKKQHGKNIRSDPNKNIKKRWKKKTWQQ